MLNLQGVSWIKRKAMAAATVTVFMKQTKKDNGVECISISQAVFGGDPTEPVDRVLDWAEHTIEINLFGPCVTKAKRVTVEELDEAYLKEGWTTDTLENGCILVHLSSQGKHGWSTKQVRYICDLRKVLTIYIAAGLGNRGGKWRETPR